MADGLRNKSLQIAIATGRVVYGQIVAHHSEVILATSMTWTKFKARAVNEF